MLEQINFFYDMILRFISEIPVSEFLYEIAGAFFIVVLLLVFRGIRKRRKVKRRLSREGLSDSESAKDIIHAPDAPLYPSELDIADSYPPSESVLPEADAVTETAPEVAPPEKVQLRKKSPRKKRHRKKKRQRKKKRKRKNKREEKKIAQAAPKKPVSFMERLKNGLSKTRNSLSTRFDAVFSGNRKIDDDLLEEIEEVLITSDIGVPTTMALMERIGKNADQIANADEFKAALKKEMRTLVDFEAPVESMEKPHVVMVVGVNGVGKTTTIGKLAAKYAAEGKKVLLSASDTFRAAAVEQLEIWAQRAGADIVRHKDKSDPAAVAFDSVEAAMARDIDVVIVDTAGRLHTKVNLMEELKKIKRSIGKKIPSAPHEIFLVLDATTGQNAVSQAQLFDEHIDLTGIILTKLDGTAKGGIVLGICHSLKVPIRYIGIGEGIDDLQKFDPALFVDALL
ncbi:MAG: signal recognition particle-docking protein FtsY [Desulfobacterales bacterium]